MKTKKKYLFLLMIAAAGIASVTVNAQSRQGQSAGWNVKEISMTKWNEQNGLPYSKLPGVNLGAVSFEVISENKIAFLSNASNEILITDKASGKVVKKFPVSFSPQDFVYDKGFFYVLDEQFVNVYSESGAFVKKLTFPNSYLGVERITRFNNATYLLLPSGNSLNIELSRESEGWITASGNFVITKLTGDNSYSIKVITAGGKVYEKTLNSEKTIAGVYVTGATDSRVFLDVQTYISESPISVERNIIAVELHAGGLGNIVNSIKVPDCYYVLSNNDFHVSADNSILNMVTSPQGVFVFSLTETNKAKKAGYPALLTAVKYHFNDHLIQAETK